MKRALTGVAAASILIGLPLAAAAHDDDRGHGRDGHSKHYGQYDKRQQAHRHYYQAPPVVYYRPAPRVVYRPAPPPRVVGYPVYVPAPVALPAPPRPWPLNQVDIGFRIFF
jgi:hypothetical protein